MDIDFNPIHPNYGNIIIITIGIICMTLVIIGLIDISRRTFRKDIDKIFWLLLIVLTGGIGTIIYLFRRRNIIIK